MAAKNSFIVRLITSAWQAIDWSRRAAMNLVFVILVIVLLSFLFSDESPKIPDSAALVIAPRGTIVEQLDGDARQRALQKVLGAEDPQTLLKDIIDAIQLGRDDDRIKAIFLNLNAMGGASLTKLQEIRAALVEFKASGKKVIAAADTYSQSSYSLAAVADEILLHKMGIVILEGFSRYRTFYKDGLDRLAVEWNVFRVGEYKSAVEPYLRNEMSEEARRANLDWLGDLWEGYLNDLSESRSLSADKIMDTIDRYHILLREAGGDSAKMALEMGLVDRVVSRDEVRQTMIDHVGEDKKSHSFHQIGFADYLKSVGGDRFGRQASGDLVGVIVAKGSILDGSQPPGNIGGDSTAALIRKARNDKKIKALVLRVDSGGGSAFASEVIRREFELARSQGKPVVVSMGGVAASGGYWISMASDEIWASPNTITGSIGIFGMFPTFQNTLSKYLGVRVDGVGTTRLSGALRPDRALQPEVAEIIQLSINQGYQDFISKVAESRQKTVEEVDSIARGRVWSGADAHSHGLVDQLGGLNEAIESAAKLADIADDYSVKYMEKEISFQDRMIIDLITKLGLWFGLGERSTLPKLPGTNLMSQMAAEFEFFSQLNDPKGVYSYCFCEVE